MPHLRLFRRIVPAAFLIATAASLAACDVVINSMEGGIGGGRFRVVKDYAKTFTLGGAAGTVEIVNTSGKINVEAVDGNIVDVKAHITARGASMEAALELLKQVEMQADASQTRVRVQAKYPGSRNAVEVVYTLRVPRNVKVNLQNVNGTIDVTGVRGGLQAETTNGGVKGRDLANTVNASTTNGGLDIQMTSVGPDGVTLETTNGGIELKLPAETKATLKARSVNGGISVTDLPFEKDSDSNRRKVDGKINGGGPVLSLETVNGGVRVRQVEAGGKEGGKVGADLDRPGDRHGLKGLKALKGLHGYVG
ncbi:MAG: DUF4097 family beta strand repeat-containing protein [Acidobacteria bacterium]|nr:DUF4097 family beta strand repeat-containing protein [Acidobacteriota bacterium]